MSVLIWVQTVCKGYQQTTKVAASKERDKNFWIRTYNSGLHNDSGIITDQFWRNLSIVGLTMKVLQQGICKESTSVIKFQHFIFRQS